MADEDLHSTDSSVSGVEGYSTFEQFSLQKQRLTFFKQLLSNLFAKFRATFWEISSNLSQALRRKELGHLFRAEKRATQLSAHPHLPEQ